MMNTDDWVAELLAILIEQTGGALEEVPADSPPDFVETFLKIIASEVFSQSEENQFPPLEEEAKKTAPPTSPWRGVVVGRLLGGEVIRMNEKTLSDQLEADSLLVTISEECSCGIVTYPDKRQEIWHCRYHASADVLLEWLKHFVNHHVNHQIYQIDVEAIPGQIEVMQRLIGELEEAKRKCLKK